ncbi:MAG: hypothetical protein VKJ06_02210 [Vampirovibrionales bacterium]|nr:hypothetical protein [Vampirovibrionales bacterium]
MMKHQNHIHAQPGRRVALGQGAVEYAGAIIMAALIIGAILVLAPFNMGTMFSNLLINIATGFESILGTVF